MYVKEITIEGFKSYAQSTTISQFDPHFNAITGLNGSGKSNILDSICFVLGILNLSQVRATNLQELIYKGGNAGITKATVSITFDNSDKGQSPPGYQEYEQIIVTRQISTGGKHKYLINGSTVPNQRVCDLFCSVQLNVNNPNFLIMQGKITKVLNMKPIEILSMIEEAAGTKTYDMKKLNALQTIEKKNAKLNEIERVLREDITPMIDKLKSERAAFVEYKKIEREYDILHRFTIAHQYYALEESLSKSKHDSEQIENDIDNHQNRIQTIDSKIETLKNEIKEMQKDKTNDSRLNELEAQFKQMEKDEAKLKTEIDSLSKNIKAEEKRRNENNKLAKESSELMKQKEKKLESLQQMNEKTQNEYKSAEEDLKKAQTLYEALCCGLSANEDGTLATLQDQLLNIRSKISENTTTIKQAELSCKRAEDESNKLSKGLNASSIDYEEKNKNCEKLNMNFERVKTDLEKLNFDTQLLNNLNLDTRRLKNEIYQINERIESFYTRYPQLKLRYKDPEPNFDRKRVSGLVCDLFKLKDPKYATALEVAAGGKLYNLVVDTDKTGRLILQNGGLERKVTIIPMNQIRPFVINSTVIETAKNFAGADNVHHALSLIDYDPKYHSVMEFVFGARLICTTLDWAKKIAFLPGVLTTTVTLDGDNIDPEGVMSGGSRGERVAVLMKLDELNRDKRVLEEKQKEISNLDKRLANAHTESAKYTSLKGQYDQISNELNSAKSALEQNEHHQKLEKYKSLQNELEQKKALIKQSSEDLKNLEKKKDELEDKLNNQDTFKEKEKKTAQETIKRSKEFLDKHSKSSQDYQKEYDMIKGEIERLKKETEDYTDELVKIEEAIRKLNENIEEINVKVAELREKEDELLGEINGRKEVINAKCNAINSKNDESDKLQRERNAAELQIKELHHKKSNLIEHLAGAEEKLEHLMHTHSWITDERLQFGKANTPYDFQKHDIKEVNHRLHNMKSRKDKLSKSIDQRGMNLLTKKEEEYEDLTKKRAIVLRDRSTLESTIESLEQTKIEVLQKAFQSINKDLGSIFKTLLPGAFAKLEPTNRNQILDGVEFKVAFGEEWKESLTELSGGQRSLVALSLILSLLRYKPAPLYILDEVDAALDSSHTQNIGLMIKKHFKNSQFIIVSLKDGMYNNSNVLFRTKLIDGVSTVARYEQKKGPNKENIAQEA